LNPRAQAALSHAPERLGVRDVEHALEERVGELDRAALITPSSSEANEAPPKPLLVGGLADQHERPRAVASGTRLWRIPSRGASPTAMTLTRQLASKPGSKITSPPRSERRARLP